MLVALLVVLAAFPVARQEGDPRVVTLAEHGLTLTLPPLEGLGAGQNRWHGRLGPSKVEIAFRTFAVEKYGFTEPDDLLDLSAWNTAPEERSAPGSRRSVAGPFGHAAYASYERSDVLGSDGKTKIGARFLLGGLLAGSGYVVTVEALPAPAEDGEAALRAFLEKGIVYQGPVREHRWTDEEARARWLRDAPPETHAKYEEPIRTDHYIILTNSSGGKLFAKKMEECHAAIRAVYPFDDVPGRLLLPVFLFRTADEYYAYYAKIAKKSLEDARRSKGHAWRDYYATWYDAPGDPVHIHEATHQIFANRLGLGGGGSWFQEGVAEYMSSKPGDRSAVAGKVKKQKHVPLAELVVIPSLLMSSDEDAPGGDSASDNYDQAALLIEFLRESKWAKDRFPDFLVRVGRLPRGDLVQIQGAIEELYGVDLAGLEERWVEYCKKR